MPGPYSIVPALVLAVVFAGGAIGKLRSPEELRDWADLGVPAMLRRSWLLRLHPWLELALALALALLGGLLGMLAALAAIVLLSAYTWMLLAALRRSRLTDTDALCACFGSRRPITRLTVARNLWLLLLALAAASATWTDPLWGGPIAAAGGDWAWVAGLAAAGLTAILVVWQEPVTAMTAKTTPTADDDGEYVRTRTPAVPVLLADGTTVNLRRLAERRPILLFAVSESCGACEDVVARIPAWRELLPEVDVRLLLHTAPESSRYTEHDEPQSLHDRGGYVRGSIADWPVPTAVLLGIDGLLAGGPISGTDQVAEFVGDVYESLHGERPPVVSVEQ